MVRQVKVVAVEETQAAFHGPEEQLIIVCICASVRFDSCVDVGVATSTIYTELWAAEPSSLHFPMQPNLSQWTKPCQIRADSYRSISSTQTGRLHRQGDYAKGVGDSRISWLRGSLWRHTAYRSCSDVSLPKHQHRYRR